MTDTPAVTLLAYETEPRDIEVDERFVRVYVDGWVDGVYIADRDLTAKARGYTRHRVVPTPPSDEDDDFDYTTTDVGPREPDRFQKRGRPSPPLERPETWQEGDQVAIVFTRAVDWWDSEVGILLDYDLPADAQVVHLAVRRRTAVGEASEILKKNGWTDEMINKVLNNG